MVVVGRWLIWEACGLVGYLFIEVPLEMNALFDSDLGTRFPECPIWDEFPPVLESFGFQVVLRRRVACSSPISQVPYEQLIGYKGSASKALFSIVEVIERPRSLLRFWVLTYDLVHVKPEKFSKPLSALLVPASRHLLILR